MSFLDSMSISGSALTATRLRMEVITENIANSNTTRTSSGEPYRRKYVVFQEKTNDTAFAEFFNKPKMTSGGVRVLEIGTDMSEFKYDYNPSHPDADENGYVRMPNVEVVQEMVDMMSAYRAYEANITALNAFKDMALKTFELGK
ncbi:MAG: flagellar basal body rod protein FlgC [Oscillospiraceae bacterium]|nr:flagellar basal body rod protein FlgC [Oscillospiraceae bacterium]